MNEPTIELSIIIPAYMEAGVIADSLQKLAAFLKTRDYGVVEVLVIEQNSLDGTARIALSQAKLFQHFRLIETGPRQGKGYAVRAGMFEARGRYRLFMDADLATPLIHLDQVKTFMDHRGQIGIAVRNLFSIHPGLMRKIMSKSVNIVAQILVVPGVKDTQCGFKVFEAEAAKAIFGRLTLLGWSFDLELLAIARQLHYRIDFFEVPDWSDPKLASDGLVGDSQLKIIFGGLLDPLKIRLGIWTGRYHRAYYPK